MKFEERIAEFPGRKLLRKRDAHNNPIGDPILVTLERNEGQVYETGTAVTAENLNKGNWRDDDSLSFKMRAGGLPEARPDETQIVTAPDGKTWIIPPEGLGCAKEIKDRVGSVVTIGGCKEDISFVSDPQTQLNGKLDKTTSTAENVRAYCVDSSGNQNMISMDALDSVGETGYIFTRNSRRSISLAEYGVTYMSYDAVPKKYIDDAIATIETLLDGKLDKVTTSDADRRVYAIGYNGEQVIYPVENGYGSGPVGYIVARNSNYSINLPVSGRDYIDSDAVPKKYIDDADARKQDKLTAGEGIIISGGTIHAAPVQKYIHNIILIGTTAGKPTVSFQIINRTGVPYASIADVIAGVIAYAGTTASSYIMASGGYTTGGVVSIATGIRGGVPGECILHGYRTADGQTTTTNTYASDFTAYFDHVIPL